MNTSEQSRAVVKQGEFALLAGLPTPKDAADKTVRLCDTEQDAIAVSIALSHITQAEIARRMGVARSYLTMLKTGERVLTRKMTGAFCSATGSNLVRQYRDLHSAWRVAKGQTRIIDRIESIAAYTREAA